MLIVFNSIAKATCRSVRKFPLTKLSFTGENIVYTTSLLYAYFLSSSGVENLAYVFVISSLFKIRIHLEKSNRYLSIFSFYQIV